MATKIGSTVTSGSNVIGPFSVAAGDALVFGMKFENGATLTGLTDGTAPATVIVQKAYTGSPAEPESALAVVFNHPGGTVTYTASFAGSAAFIQLNCEIWRGISSADGFSSRDSTDGFGDGQTFSAPNITTTGPGLVVQMLAGYQSVSGVTTTGSSPAFTRDTTTEVGESFMQYLISGSAQTVTPGATWASSPDRWVLVAAAFKDGTAGTPIGQASETATAQAFGAMPKLIGQAFEVDLAQLLALIDYGQAGDLFLFGDDAGNESTFGGLRLFGGAPATGVTASIGQASETGLAQAMARAQARAIGIASETGAAQAFGQRQARAMGQAAEADSAQPMATSTAGVLGQPTEADLAQALTRLQRAVVGQAAETAAAQPFTARRSLPIGLPAETDVAQPVVSRQLRALGQAQETGAAQPFAVLTAGVLGQPSEADAAQPVVAAQRRTIGLASEVAVAQAVSIGGAGGAVGQAQEADAAQQFVARLLRSIGMAPEVDSAQPAQVVVGRAIGMAVELDAALAVARRQLAALGIAIEFDAALALQSAAQPIGAGRIYVLPAENRVWVAPPVDAVFTIA